MEKTGGPAPDGQSLRCPRCDSSNTKFCYYNNYSLSQPRHFCKACKRYWTRGGTLRNVPVGGGCRKNKRVRKSSAAPTAAPPSQTDLSPSAPPLSFLPSSSPIATASGDLGFLFYNLANSAPDVGLPGLPAPYDLSLGFPSNTEEDYLPRLNPLQRLFKATLFLVLSPYLPPPPLVSCPLASKSRSITRRQWRTDSYRPSPASTSLLQKGARRSSKMSSPCAAPTGL
ncbi:unnamed protein product [Spirodela intermedia]|uniref:Dof zinc finger protein n=1 Tax=Spirodela intermedia TaxID=51605 RepID=A0A7I8IHP4_SPIIN|nr:unnamed protein product [Spirodela intermedia]CAA6656603.1 unnamed protein product [Spirodela intermedia]